MNARTARRLALGLWILAVLFALADVPLAVANRSFRAINPIELIGEVIGLIWASLGALIAGRRGNAIGWLFCAIGVSIAMSGTAIDYTVYGLKVNTAAPGVPVAAVIGEYALFGVATLGLLFLLFPDGRVPSPRWRVAAWAILGGTGVATIGSILKPETLNNYRDYGISYPNPTGVPSLAHVAPTMIAVGTFAAIFGSLAAVVALVVRFRRARGEERQQMKWLGYVGAVALILFVAWGLLGATAYGPENAYDVLLAGVAATIALGVPAAVTFAVFKYRLYGIDVVINQTLVYGALAAFITAVYVGIVVGIGAAIGQGTSKPNLGLSILATGVVAVAFQPVRARVQRFANRLVYGKRATPYEVLSEFGHRMAATYAAEDVLPRMARILAEGTGAKEAKVWLGRAGQLKPAATWPDANGDGHATSADADLIIPVSHQGDELGALSIVKAAGDRITPAEEKLTRDLAGQAGLVLRNVRLIEDLKASRVRLVQAQDEERRKIERNIHDGAQQQLVALNVKLGLTRTIAASDSAKAEELLAQLQEDTNQALSDLRDLARGIYPPLLADQGLTTALESQARKSTIPVTVEAEAITRYPQDLEAAVYFCTLEALQNVAKYANAARATVSLSAADGYLAFTITDDGAGFDTTTTSYGTGLQGMADRLSALGGDMEIRSQPGHGTTIIGRVRVRPVEMAR